MKIFNEGENIVIGDFDEIEALRVAVKLENDGMKFYLKSSELAPDEETKQMFKNLVKEEAKHIQRFEKRAEEIGKAKNIEVDLSRGGEEEFFDFIDPGVFGDTLNIEKVIAGVNNCLDALTIGEQSEVNAINFYKAILKHNDSEAGKAVIKDIIKEEQKHLKTLIKYKELLEKKGGK
ncbi:MAG: ferritin family protein [Candidatus Margulisbacteria bacterium]|nr:ferritin family protein [Candidatus Margulisiibacteriota bacterium]MBU1022371.1 ferritin family protein [Candidatus Margulisiibacteriota bacterium]MBU1729077.1 ferritin family protein [Candidatus Margulisiibacteriota bacterium]MBU1954502.1 ferritin family protein [Candidatus Margulisiibacteriota bacterium]